MFFRNSRKKYGQFSNIAFNQRTERDTLEIILEIK